MLSILLCNVLRLAYVHSALQSGGLQYSGKEPSGEGPEGQNRTGGTPVQAHLLICSTQPRGARPHSWGLCGGTGLQQRMSEEGRA